MCRLIWYPDYSCLLNLDDNSDNKWRWQLYRWWNESRPHHPVGNHVRLPGHLFLSMLPKGGLGTVGGWRERDWHPRERIDADAMCPIQPRCFHCLNIQMIVGTTWYNIHMIIIFFYIFLKRYPQKSILTIFLAINTWASSWWYLLLSYQVMHQPQFHASHADK